MDRRSFLSTIAGAGAALAFDPELFGWVKRKSIFIPPQKVIQFYPKYYSVDIVISGDEYNGLFAKWLGQKQRRVQEFEHEMSKGIFVVPFGFAVGDAVEIRS